MPWSLPRYLRGQSLILVVFFLALIFLVIGLALDGGMLYLQRRTLQNIADAACLAAANRLSLGESAAQSRQAAVQSVVQNISLDNRGGLAFSDVGEVYNYDRTEGSGASLSHGIEIAAPQARIALRSPAYTYFMRLLGIGQVPVAARTRCDAAAGSGITPFAVARWRGYRSPRDPRADTSNPESPQNIVLPGPTTDRPLPQRYGQGNRNFEYVVRDILRPAGNSVITQWPGWGASPHAPAQGYPGNPLMGNECCLYSDPQPAASPAAPGPLVIIAGPGAQPNTEPSSARFEGVVVLDLRQVTWPNVEYYNGLTPQTSPQSYKQFVERYLLTGYPGPIVLAGQQLAFHNGVSAGLSTLPLVKRYQVGDEIPVLVYNGSIYQDPNYILSLELESTIEAQTPTLPLTCTTDLNSAGYLITGTSTDSLDAQIAAKYSVKVTPDNASAFRMRTFFSTDAQDWGAAGRWESGGWLALPINPDPQEQSIGLAGRTLNFSLRSTKSADCFVAGSGIKRELPIRKRGAETVYIELQDSSTGKRRAVYGRLATSPDADDFFIYFPGTLIYAPMEPNTTTQVPLRIERFDTGAVLPVGSGGVSLSFDWFAPTNLLTPLSGAVPLLNGSQLNGVRVAVVSDGHAQQINHQLKVETTAGALTRQEYYLRITATLDVGGKSYRHAAWYYIAVRTALTESQGVKDYIHALGYSTFRLEEIGSNYIMGRAVSGLATRREEIMHGMQPRMLGWDE